MLIKDLSEEEGGLKSDGIDEEENEDMSDVSDEEDSTSSDED